MLGFVLQSGLRTIHYQSDYHLEKNLSSNSFPLITFRVGDDDGVDGPALAPAAVVDGNDVSRADPAVPTETDSASIPGLDALTTVL